MLIVDARMHSKSPKSTHVTPQSAAKKSMFLSLVGCGVGRGVGIGVPPAVGVGNGVGIDVKNGAAVGCRLALDLPFIDPDFPPLLFDMLPDLPLDLLLPDVLLPDVLLPDLPDFLLPLPLLLPFLTPLCSSTVPFNGADVGGSVLASLRARDRRRHLDSASPLRGLRRRRLLFVLPVISL